MEPLHESDIVDRLCQEYFLTQRLIQRLTESIANAIPGTLVPKKVRQYTYYELQICQNGQRSRSHVRQKDLPSIQEQIRRRQYQERQLRQLREHLEKLRKSLRHFQIEGEDIINRYHRWQQEQKKQAHDRWLAQKAVLQQPYRANLKYWTLNGECVRSKSEALLADLFYSFKIPYEYSPMVRLGDKTVEADFRIQSTLYPNRIYYWEHFGLMDDETYRQRCREKLEAYHLHGYREGKNLIATHEDRASGLDMQEIMRLLFIHQII